MKYYIAKQKGKYIGYRGKVKKKDRAYLYKVGKYNDGSHYNSIKDLKSWYDDDVKFIEVIIHVK